MHSYLSVVILNILEALRGFVNLRIVDIISLREANHDYEKLEQRGFHKMRITLCGLLHVLCPWGDTENNFPSFILFCFMWGNKQQVGANVGNEAQKISQFCTIWQRRTRQDSDKMQATWVVERLQKKKDFRSNPPSSMRPACVCKLWPT